MIKGLGRRFLELAKGYTLRKSLSGKSKRTLPEKPARILCLQMNAIGDAIMTQPAWANLKASFPESTIDLVCRPHIAPLFKEDPSIDQLFPFDSERYRSWRFRDGDRMTEWVPQGDYDLLVDATALPITGLICARPTSPPSVGFQRTMETPLGKFDLGLAYDHSCPYSETESIRDLMQGLVRAYTGTDPRIGVSELYLSASAMEKGRLFLEKKGLEEGEYIVLHPGAKWPPKRWPTACWRQLTVLLREKHKLPVLVMGNSEDSALVDGILAGPEPNNPRACISDDLVFSATIIKMATLCVCNDSAAMHMAAALDTPSVALFGPVSPGRSAPSREEGCRVLYDRMFCSPCTLYYSRDRCRRGINFCMHAIEPHTVFEEVERALAR